MTATRRHSIKQVPLCAWGPECLPELHTQEADPALTPQNPLPLLAAVPAVWQRAGASSGCPELGELAEGEEPGISRCLPRPT